MLTLAVESGRPPAQRACAAQRTCSDPFLNRKGAGSRVAGGGADSGEGSGLDEERGGVEEVVVAAVVGDEKAHDLVGAHGVLGRFGLAEQLSTGVVGVGVGALGVELEAAAVDRREE